MKDEEFGIRLSKCCVNNTKSYHEEVKKKKKIKCKRTTAVK